MWVGLWLAWVVVVVESAIVQRSSDPASMQPVPQVSGPVHPPPSNDPFDASALPNVPIGNPENMGTDKIGRALDPEDFMLSDEMVDDQMDLANVPDPTSEGKWFEGDIIIESEEKLAMIFFDRGTEPAPRSAIVESSKKWPNGVIPYVISSSYTNLERSTIAKAMKIIKDKTKCIRFVPRKEERDYVHFLKGDGCSSSVGRIGGAQALSLGPGCLYVGVVLHEMTHCVGFWHEHSRTDRDQYIQINRDNIITGMEYNFKKYNKFQIKHLAPYDLGSIMHYGPTAFAKDRSQPTIIPLSRGPTIGQRKGFSEYDIQKIQTLYCPEHLTNKPASIINEIATGGEGGGGGGPACDDKAQFCREWAKAGECRANPNYMNVHCCIACAEKIQPSDCIDEHKHCGAWSRTNQCVANADYMSRYCKKSCKMCHTQTSVKPGQPCVDANAYCTKWAQTNECQANPLYMKVQCAKSCGAC